VNRVDVACLLLRMFQDTDFVLRCLVHPLPAKKAENEFFTKRISPWSELDTPFTVTFKPFNLEVPIDDLHQR
jgi:hypothetical protein